MGGGGFSFGWEACNLQSQAVADAHANNIFCKCPVFLFSLSIMFSKEGKRATVTQLQGKAHECPSCTTPDNNECGPQYHPLIPYVGPLDQ